MINVKAIIKKNIKTAIKLERYDIASRLCLAMETAIRVDMNTVNDFGGEWASIECDIEVIKELAEA